MSGAAVHRASTTTEPNGTATAVPKAILPETVLVDPCRDPRWERLAIEHGGSLFVSPPWLRAIEATYGFTMEARCLVDRSDQQPLTGMVYSRLDDALGHRTVSTPFCDFCDPVGPIGREEADLLLESLFGDASTRLKMRVLDAPAVSTHPRFRIAGEDFWHGVALDRGDDEMWSSLGSTGRRNVKRARNAGVTVRFDEGLGAVDRFFDMHRYTRRSKYGMLAQPRAFFHRIHDEFSPDDGISVALAEHEGETLAGIFLITWNGRTYYKFNASAPDGLALRPNDLLMWESILWSREQGSSLLDLGLSDADQEGLIRYKRKYATVEGRVATLVAGPERSAGADALGSLLREMTSVLTDERIPDDLAERAGAAMYRYFT